MMMRALASVLALAAVHGCDTPPPAATLYAVMIRAATEDGDPLASVDITARDQVVGQTDKNGALLARLSGEEGADVSFSPSCPAGSRPLGTPPSLRLRTLSAEARPEVEVTCGRDKRTAALLVSAPGFGGLPILVHDREIGRTDSSGTAHVLLQGEPATPLRVVLDTRSLPNVVPASPHRDLQIGTRDDLVVFAPELAETKRPERKRRHEKKAPSTLVYRPEKLR